MCGRGGLSAVWELKGEEEEKHIFRLNFRVFFFLLFEVNDEFLLQ